LEDDDPLMLLLLVLPWLTPCDCYCYGLLWRRFPLPSGFNFCALLLLLILLPSDDFGAANEKGLEVVPAAVLPFLSIERLECDMPNTFENSSYESSLLFDSISCNFFFLSMSIAVIT
jgi:hypothetical protein